MKGLGGDLIWKFSFGSKIFVIRWGRNSSFKIRSGDVGPTSGWGEISEENRYATTYRANRDAYLKAANELKLATGPYKAARDAYVAATATYTKSLYE